MNPLAYRIRDLEAHPGGLPVDQDLTRAFVAEALQGTEVEAAQSSAHVAVRLLHSGVIVHMQGVLTGDLAAVCQRCLAPTTLAVEVPLNTTYLPSGTVIQEDAEALLDPDDVDYAHHDRDTVDLSGVLREALLLSIPIAILCREECLGLCPVCGGDRNTRPCECGSELALSPFQALKNIKLS